jgi:predicted ATP-grasp superfamily ATP-dependent carboligase
MIKFLVLNVFAPDWLIPIKNNSMIIYINENKLNNYDDENYKILPITTIDFKKYNNHHKCIFKNNIDNIDILDNKSKFSKYMMNNFINNISKIYYYNFNDETYINNDTNNRPLIKKNNYSFAGFGIMIMDKINKIKNIVISEYINHTSYFVGHFIVLNGIILDKIYFFSNIMPECKILKGNITNYIIYENLNVDESIFNNIFNNLNYCGFACCDFIIVNDIIKIFEINPRIGGSLINNDVCFNKFLNKILENI